jgi:hypothetical protein
MRRASPFRLPTVLATLLCVLAPLTALAGAATGRATSPSCLRGCLSSCAQAPARADCLRACLDACPAYCGALDTDCAMRLLEAARPDALTGEDAARLADHCARACLIKPNCGPPKAAPAAAADSAAPEVSAEEYAVYAAFLLSGGVAEAGDVPPYLRDVARVRTVYGRTVAGPELKPEDTFAVCGGLPEGLSESYAARRAERVLVRDRLPVPKLHIRDESAARPPLMPELMPERMPERMTERLAPRPGQLLPGPALEFSRAGLSVDGDAALFYVTDFGTSPGTSHLVLMVRREGVWRLRCASMRDMRIY